MPPTDLPVLTWEPCEINILIVVDGDLSFGSGEFGLGKLIGVLEDDLLNYARFKVRTQRRDKANTYRFDTDPDFHTAHQIWMFGDTSPELDNGIYLTAGELEVLSKFMDRGGVFATGDHEDLGAFLNGYTPRVKSMRKWFFEKDLPIGQCKAPPRNDAFRHDSLAKGYYEIYFDTDQKDDVPQMIEPEMYKLPNHPFFKEKLYPHPLLSIPEGIINVLPDHMHEGECYVSCQLAENEFPIPPGKKVRPLPLVIAKAKVIESHTTYEVEPRSPHPHTLHPTTEVTSFGLIGVYNGHKVGKGRVVVDSSFHHFVNMNLKGFELSEEDDCTYKRIKSYYRNIALWLAPKDKQRGMFECVLLETLLILNLPANLPHDEKFVIELGRKARGILELQTSPSLALQWTLDFIAEISDPDVAIPLPDPWLYPGLPDAYQDLLFDIESLADAVIGGALFACVTTPATDIKKVIEEGAKKGVIDLLQRMDEYKKALDETQAAFKKAFKI
jgi:hypothetical protein